MISSATTVEEYLAALAPDRRDDLQAVRRVILDNLPDGYAETMSFGMVGYVVPLELYPKTYNGQPLMYAALASQKNHMSVHLMAVYGEGEREFRAHYARTGKRLDMGRSCVRFKTLDDLALEPVATAVASVPVDEFIRRYEESRAGAHRG